MGIVISCVSDLVCGVSLSVSSCFKAKTSSGVNTKFSRRIVRGSCLAACRDAEVKMVKGFGHMVVLSHCLLSDSSNLLLVNKPLPVIPKRYVSEQVKLATKVTWKMACGKMLHVCGLCIMLYTSKCMVPWTECTLVQSGATADKSVQGSGLIRWEKQTDRQTPDR